MEEYLKTVYRPDCDYVDGVVEERTLGERDYSDIQGNLVMFFRAGFRQTGIKAYPVKLDGTDLEVPFSEIFDL